MATPPTDIGDIPSHRRFAAWLGLVILQSVDALETSAPTVISGGGAPTMTAPQGSFYLRDDGTTPESNDYRMSVGLGIEF